MLGLKREIDQVAKDKGLDSKEIIAALEEAMRQAAKRERGLETEIDARFNEELGEIELFEFREVVDEVTDKNAHISLNDAKAYDPDAEIGDEIGVKVDTSSFGRILAHALDAGDVAALQIRLDKRKSRLLFVLNLLALLSTLMLAWIVYTQIVVIQHHWARLRRPVAKPAPSDDEPASTVD